MEGLWCGKLCCDSLDRKFEKKKKKHLESVLNSFESVELKGV